MLAVHQPFIIISISITTSLSFICWHHGDHYQSITITTQSLSSSNLVPRLILPGNTNHHHYHVATLEFSQLFSQISSVGLTWGVRPTSGSGWTWLYCQHYHEDITKKISPWWQSWHHHTCLCSTASKPCVRGFSKAEPRGTSRRSFTGSGSPLDKASKYLNVKEIQLNSSSFYSLKHNSLSLI